MPDTVVWSGVTVCVVAVLLLCISAYRFHRDRRAWLSRPAHLKDLELATTEEITEELRRRTAVRLLVVALQEDGNRAGLLKLCVGLKESPLQMVNILQQSVSLVFDGLAEGCE